MPGPLSDFRVGGGGGGETNYNDSTKIFVLYFLFRSNKGKVCTPPHRERKTQREESEFTTVANLDEGGEGG